MTEWTLFCYRCHWSNQYVSQEHDSLYSKQEGLRARGRSLRMALYKGITKHSSSQINQKFHYKALHGKVSNYYVDKRHMMLIFWAGPFLVMVKL